MPELRLQVIERMPLYDGSPRREKGARAYLHLVTRPGKTYQSPLLRNKVTAERFFAFCGPC